MLTASTNFVVPSGFFSTRLLVIISLTLQISEKYIDIVKGDRDNNEGVYTRKFGFEVLSDNIKVFY